MKLLKLEVIFKHRNSGKVEHRLKTGRKKIELKLTRDRKANNDNYLQGVKNRILPRSGRRNQENMIKI